jgi:hypothetical protein
MFAAVAIVFRYKLIVLIVALRALPVEDKVCFFIKLLVDILYPLFDTFEVHGYATASTSPDPILSSDLF